MPASGRISGRDRRSDRRRARPAGRLPPRPVLARRSPGGSGRTGQCGQIEPDERPARASPAIVTERPGTTRDYLEEETALDGLPVRLVDTAGLRADSDDPIEREGMRRGRELADAAQAVLLVLDGALAASAPSPWAVFTEEKALVEAVGASRCLAVWNKADVAPLPPMRRTFTARRFWKYRPERAGDWTNWPPPPGPCAARRNPPPRK